MNNDKMVEMAKRAYIEGFYLAFLATSATFNGRSVSTSADAVREICEEGWVNFCAENSEVLE